MHDRGHRSRETRNEDNVSKFEMMSFRLWKYGMLNGLWQLVTKKSISPQILGNFCDGGVNSDSAIASVASVNLSSN